MSDRVELQGQDRRWRDRAYAWVHRHPVTPQLALVVAVIAVGHVDTALEAMLVLGWVAVVPVAYAMARLPRPASRGWLHAALLGGYVLMDAGRVDFTSDRLDILVESLAFLLAMELLWWVALLQPIGRVPRFARAAVRYAMLPLVTFELRDIESWEVISFREEDRSDTPLPANAHQRRSGGAPAASAMAPGQASKMPANPALTR